MAKVDLTGLRRLITHLEKLGRPDPKLLLDRTIIVMAEDNRKGVLAGKDKDGRPMDPVTYRPKGQGWYATARQRNHGKARAKVGRFGGLGPMAAGLHNNLSRREYERLNGPPLAPRRQHSRVITNYRLTPVTYSPLHFGVIGLWFEVVDQKGRPFLHHLFKRRDIRGVRPEAMRELRRSFANWARDQIRYRKGAA